VARARTYNPRAVRREILATCIVLLAMIFTPSNSALAASDLYLQRAADGTWLVEGRGWRPGDELDVSLGQEHFTTYVDDAGDFEVATGAAMYQGEPAVHHPARLELQPIPLGLHPLAVALVQALAQGTALLGAVVGVGALGAGVHRWRRRA
jgi:hypothetical protein